MLAVLCKPLREGLKKIGMAEKNLFRVVFAHRFQNFFRFLFGRQIEID
jgi:hypothetical protein